MMDLLESTLKRIVKIDARDVAKETWDEIQAKIYPAAQKMTMKFPSNLKYNWLVDWRVVFGIPALYLVAVFIFSRYMLDKEASKPKRMMMVYNVVQIVVCSWMVYVLAPTDFFGNYFCINSEHTAMIEFGILIHYLSKYLDYCDTFFMIARRKYRQVSFLQVTHHATISAVWGFVLMSGYANGTVRYGAWINSLTHVIMYSHHLVTSFGIRNPFKRFITSFQIAQFASCEVHCLVFYLFENNAPKSLALLQVIYHIYMLYLFIFKMHYSPSFIHGYTRKWQLLDGEDWSRRKRHGKKRAA